MMDSGQDWQFVQRIIIFSYWLLEVLLSCSSINVNMTVDSKCMDLKKKHGNVTPLVVACCSKNHEIVRRLLQVPGIDVNYKCGEWQWTAMHFAAWRSVECCEELAKCPEVDWNSVSSQENRGYQ